MKPFSLRESEADTERKNALKLEPRMSLLNDLRDTGEDPSLVLEASKLSAWKRGNIFEKQGG